MGSLLIGWPAAWGIKLNPSPKKAGLGQDFSVGQLCIARNVGDLNAAKLADLSLELQPGECMGHLPELDVPCRRGRAEGETTI